MGWGVGGLDFGGADVRKFANIVVSWNRRASHLGWLLPVALTMLVTMVAAVAFDLLLDALRGSFSITEAYLIPLASVGLVSGIVTFIAVRIYRKLAEETVEEVTERLRVSGELTNERMLMRALMLNTPDHIHFKDAAGRYLRINQSLAAALGLSDPAQAIGKTDEAYFPAPVAEATAAEERQVRDSGIAVIGRELEVTWPDGRATWLSMTRLPLRDRHGRVIGTFGISRDITSAKGAELRLRQLSLAVEQSPSIVLITDVKGDITYVNPKFTKVTGYEAVEVIGQNPRILKAGELEQDLYRDMWATIVRGGEWNGEILNRKKDGEMYWGLASISPIRDASGVTTHYLEVMEDITERKEGEQALRRQFAFQRQLIDAMPIPIFHKNAEGVYRECNEAFARFIGREREAIIGHSARDIAPPDLAEHYHRQDMRLIEQGGQQRYEGRVLHADGSRRDVMFSKAVVHDDDGKVTGLVGAIVDLTERKQAEAALKHEYQRREELEKIISMSPAVVILWRAEPGWPVEYVTDNVQQFGYAPADFTSGGLPFAQIVHPEDLGRIGAEVTDFTVRGIPEFVQQYRVFSKRGDVRWIDDRTWVRRDEQGQVTHYQGIIMDITDRKLADEREAATMDGLRAILELADALMAASSTDDLYRLAVELSRERLKLERTAIMMVQQDLIQGTYGTNLRGRTTRELDHVIHLDDTWRDRLRPRKAGENPWHIVNQPYYEWDGQSIVGFGRGWVALTPIMSHEHGAIGLFCNDTAISGAPVDEVQQEIVAVFCAMLGNIIARKRAEEEQRTIQEQHRDFMERTDRLNSLGMLAAGMAHEINNPLQGMLSHLHAVHRALKADEAARKSLVMVERGIDTIATLVRKLLIFGRSADQEGEVVDAREALDFVSHLLASQFKRTGVHIRTAARTPSLHVAMPRRYLVQVLLNLLINARDAMPAGGEITVEMDAAEDMAELRIIDGGCGIPANQLAEIFKPFYTTKGAKGSGLGLSVADSLIRSSKGTISVDSQPGRTVFTLRIPLAGIEDGK